MSSVNQISFGTWKMEFKTLLAILKYKLKVTMPRDIRRELFHAATEDSQIECPVAYLPHRRSQNYPLIAGHVDLMFQRFNSDMASIQLSISCEKVRIGCEYECGGLYPTCKGCCGDYMEFKNIFWCNQAAIPRESTIHVRRVNSFTGMYYLNIYRPDYTYCTISIVFMDRYCPGIADRIHPIDFKH